MIETKEFTGDSLKIERLENGFVVTGLDFTRTKRRVCTDLCDLLDTVRLTFRRLGEKKLKIVVEPCPDDVERLREQLHEAQVERDELRAQLDECGRRLQQSRDGEKVVDLRGEEHGIVIKRVDNGFIVESEQKTSGVPWNRRFCEDFGALIDQLCLVFEKSTRSGLRFGDLREANRRRLPGFKDAHGRPAHAEPDGSDWSPNDWYTAASGELGELGNLLKKVRRGDLDLDEAMPDIRHEIADAVCYLDLLAHRLDIDLGEAVIEKFNIVSERVGSDVRLGE